MEQQQVNNYPKAVSDFLKKFKEENDWHQGRSVVFKSLKPNVKSLGLLTHSLVVKDPDNGKLFPIGYLPQYSDGGRVKYGEIRIKKELFSEIILSNDQGARAESQLDFLLISGQCATFKDEPWHIRSNGGYKYELVDTKSKAKDATQRRMEVAKAQGWLFNKYDKEPMMFEAILDAFKFSHDLDQNTAKVLSDNRNNKEVKLDKLLQLAESKPFLFNGTKRSRDEIQVRYMLLDLQQKGLLKVDTANRKITWGKGDYPLCDYFGGAGAAWRKVAVGYLMSDEGAPVLKTIEEWYQNDNPDKYKDKTKRS